METENAIIGMTIAATLGFAGGGIWQDHLDKNHYCDGYAAGALCKPQDARKDEFFQMGHYFGSHRIPPHFDINTSVIINRGETPPPSLGIEAKVEADDQSKSAPSTPSPSRHP